MNFALQILCHRLFDYAGLFPPAKLDLNSALQYYLDYQIHKYHDMLGKFVLPANKCRETDFFLSQNKTLSVVPFSVLLSQAKNLNAFFDVLQEDYNNLCVLAKNDNCIISSFEFSLPSDCFHEHENLFSVFDKIQKQFLSLKNLSKQTAFFCEIPFLPHEEMNLILFKIKQFNEIKQNKISIKIRTGGITPQSIPTIETLTNTFLLLAKHSLSFKVTAGLHVPVPNFNQTVNAQMHGFLNVIFSSFFAFFYDLYFQKSSCSIKQTIAALLQSIDYSNCRIQNEGVSVFINDKEMFFSNKTISVFRENYFKGIGTCDFFEPIDLLFENCTIES